MMNDSGSAQERDSSLRALREVTDAFETSVALPSALDARALDAHRFDWLAKESGIAVGVIAIALSVVYLGSQAPWNALSQNAVIFPLAVLAAAAANATAVGGGFVFVPLFGWGYGLGPLECVKLALATQAFGMSSGALGWSPAYLDQRALWLGCAGASLGMLIGTFAWVPAGSWVQVLFGIMSLLIALALLIEDRARQRRAPARSVAGTLRWGYLLACIGGGTLNAWVSIGIGEVVAVWLLFRTRQPLPVAIASGVAVLAWCSLLGLAFHSQLGGIRWEFLMFTAPGALVGGRLGARLGKWLESRPEAKQGPMPRWSLRSLVVAILLVDGTIMLIKQLG